MKIGVFDSGMGGLFLLRSISKKLPRYDYIYLGDTAHLPYGNKSQSQIYKYTQQAVDYLFKNNCQLVILACNTASTSALRKIQREYLPKYYPNRRVLGVIIPTAEEVGRFSRVGILATPATVKSQAFVREIKKINPKAQIKQSPAHMLVSFIEEGRFDLAEESLPTYLAPLKNSTAIVLGCTHYPIIKKLIQKQMAFSVKIISQTDIIPSKLRAYLKSHHEIEKDLTKNSTIEFLVTRLSPVFVAQAKKWFGKNVILKKAKY